MAAGFRLKLRWFGCTDNCKGAPSASAHLPPLTTVIAGRSAGDPLRYIPQARRWVAGTNRPAMTVLRG